MDATKLAKRPPWTQMARPEDYPDSESWYAAERQRLRTFFESVHEKMRRSLRSIQVANERDGD